MGTQDDDHDHEVIAKTLPPGGDALNEGILFAAEELARTMAARGEWDLTPEIYLIGHSPIVAVDEVPEEVRAAAPDGHVAKAMQMTFMPTNMPPQLWELAPPAAIMNRLAEFAAEHGAPPVPPGMLPEDTRFIGVMFVAEAWMVLRPTDDERAARKFDKRMAKAAKGRGSLASDPDRVEVRIIHACDATGTYHSVINPRGTDEFQIRSTSATDDDHLGGAIPEAMARLVAAIVDDVDAELRSFTQE